MNWILYALGAIAAVTVSDLFRKLGSSLQDPFFSNLVFQGASVIMAILLWLVFSRRFEYNNKGVLYAFIGGLLISVFTAFLFKALEIGPGVSTVMPVVRVGGVLLVAILGVLLFGEKLTWSIGIGIFLAASGVYLIFSGK